MRTAILGFGVEGRSLADYLKKHGETDITICDERLKKLPAEYSWCAAKLGKTAFQDLAEFDRIFRSPGIAYKRKEFTDLGKKLASLTQYFFEKCPARIIGVTGTKGKGTTSSLIYEMISRWFLVHKKGHVFLGGNIGVSPLDFLDNVKKDDLVVLELSSFQLEDLKKSPTVAVVLGMSEDHQDQHGSVDEYYAAKKNIVRNQSEKDIAVIDVDNEISASCADMTPAAVYTVSMSKPQKRGAFTKVSSMIVADEHETLIVGATDETQLPGQHNIKNMLMAAATAHAVGVPVEHISAVIKEWKGLPHRLQLVCERDGAAFYDDSASTNPSTTIAAIKSFKKPITLILGGSDKNLDFTPLANEIALRTNVKRVIIMGETSPKIEAAIEIATTKIPRGEYPLEMIFAANYMEAFMVAKLTTDPGDVVLLSPACASFDMFANYKERGELFTAFVNE